MEIKEAKDLIKLKWRNLTNEEFKDLPYIVSGGIKDCTQRHIEMFIKQVIRNISREFELPVENIENIIMQENEVFFMMKNEIFSELRNSALPYDGFQLWNLLSYFKVPEMPSVDKVLREYKRLSSKQKKEFKARI